VSEQEIGSQAAIVADAVRRAESRRTVDFGNDYLVPEGAVVQILRNDERLELKDLEAIDHHPRENRGEATLHDGVSFIAYVTRLHAKSTTLWAQAPRIDYERMRRIPATVTAVFNDHTDAEHPGWRDHRATLSVQPDPDWRDWQKIDGEYMGQKAFAQFLLDHSHNIKAPSPARLMPAVLQFQAARNARYESGVNLDNGEIRMSYVEEIKNDSKGRQSVALPQEITLALYPFLGATEETEAFDVAARVRYKIPADGGELQIGIKMIRPDHVERQAWDLLSAQIAEQTPADVLMLQGEAPSSLR
jgi:uncharacterized protein YfdQ (DUF2303 family)